MTRPWVAIGVFDGVHLGHSAMLAHARDNSGGAPVTALTFDPHPRSVVQGIHPGLLCTLQRRRELLLAAGADDVRVIRFDDELRKLEPDAFVQRWLVDDLHATGIVVGENFRFGRGAAGTVELLAELGQRFGFDLSIAPLLEVDGAPVASSRIRGLVGDRGEMQAAAHLLGRPLLLEGEVVHGARRGRELGMPTANLRFDEPLVLPADGVYAGRATVQGAELLPAAISVGTNPQFTPDGERGVEVHLLDYDGGSDELYGSRLQVTVEVRVRGQETFPGVEQLVERMRQDLVEVRAVL